MTTFYGLNFVTNQDVLAPYKLTENLVDVALRHIKDLDTCYVCDVGTGSGNILISILANKKHAWGMGLDISSKALAVAKENAHLHHLDRRTIFEVSDCFSALGHETFDIITINPPYIGCKEYDSLPEKLKLRVPKFAITDGINGTSIIEKVVKLAPKYLNKNGWLVIECDTGQIPFVKQLLSSSWNSDSLEVTDCEISSILAIQVVNN